MSNSILEQKGNKMTNNMKPRRSNIDIVGDILKSLLINRGMLKPTHVMYKANLSHKLLKEYLGDLMEKGLIEDGEHDGNKMIVITEKGRNFFKEFNKLKEFRDAFGI